MKHEKSIGKNPQIQVQNRSATSVSLKILFFHNTLPEYRIGWFQNLSQMSNIEYVFTNEKQNMKDYGFEIDYKKMGDLKCRFLSDGKHGFKELQEIVEKIEKYDFVELPPIDSFRETIYSAYIVNKCKKRNVPVGYFWEKWDAPKEKQPLGRKIKNWILRVIPGSIYKHSDVIFSVGKKNREYFISNGVNCEKIKWIPDVSETSSCQYVDIREKYNIPKNSKVIMYLGRMLPQKGVGNLIKAFSTLNPEVKDTSFLLIAGDGEDLNNCQKLAKKLNLKNVIFSGRINPSDRENYFAQCDIFVYPVIYFKGRVDVWGLTLNEAMQHGKILIATDAVGSAYELIKNGINGFRVEAGNIKELKDALASAVLTSMETKAQREDDELRKIYNYQNMAKEYLQGVASVVNNK